MAGALSGEIKHHVVVSGIWIYGPSAYPPITEDEERLRALGLLDE